MLRLVRRSRCAFAVRGALRLGNGGRRAPRRLERPLRAASGARRSGGCGRIRGGRRHRRQPRSPRSPSRASRRSRATSPVICRRSCSPRSCRSWSWPGWRWSISSPALIMLFTLPLVPVFMWLIGRYTEAANRERWQALRQLATHFLDVVRGLPTLRAFGRARDQAASSRAVSDRYRRTTMETLRVSFLSGSVLELAATLGVALVAVTAGVRLADGGLGLQAGLTVLVLAPELYLPLRRLGAEYHASADGWPWPSGCSRCSTRRRRPRPAAPRSRRARPARRSGSSGVSFAYPARPAGARRARPGARTRRDRGAGGRERRGKEHGRGVAARPAGARRAGRSPSAASTSRLRARRVARPIAWVPQHPTLLRGTVADNIRLGDPERRRPAVLAAARAGRRRRVHCGAARRLRHVIGDGGRPLSSGRAAPDRPGARVPPRRAASDPRRAHGRSRPRERRDRRRGGAPAAARPDDAGDRPPARAGRHADRVVRLATAPRSPERRVGGGMTRTRRPSFGSSTLAAARVGARGRAGRADGHLRRRADGDRRLPDLPAAERPASCR